MKNKSGRYIVYVILGVVLLGMAYTACKDIVPEQERVEQAVELKLVK